MNSNHIHRAMEEIFQKIFQISKQERIRRFSLYTNIQVALFGLLVS